MTEPVYFPAETTRLDVAKVELRTFPRGEAAELILHGEKGAKVVIPVARGDWLLLMYFAQKDDK